MSWKNRIVGEGEMPASQFIAHYQNWRVHPQVQQQIMDGVLDEIGWVQRVIVNRTTGNLIDGHMRVALALSKGDDTPVPFTEIEVSESEERKILLTLDPIGAMAARSQETLESLIADIPQPSAQIEEMIAMLNEQHKPNPNPRGGLGGDTEIPEQWSILVTCKNEAEQVQLLKEWNERGLTVRPLIA